MWEWKGLDCIVTKAQIEKLLFLPLAIYQFVMSSPLSIIHNPYPSEIHTPSSLEGFFIYLFFHLVDLAESKPLTLLSKQVIFLGPYSYYPSSILKKKKKKKKD